MAKGPKRGKLQIFVDGSFKGTLDTYAATNTNRVIVWQQRLTAGSHQIRIR